LNFAGDILIRKVEHGHEITDTPLPALPDPRIGFNPRGSRRKSYPWTDRENLRLLVAVARYGARDWRSIAAFVGAGRSSNQCNQRWCRALDPSIQHKPWSETDDQKLLRTVDVLGKASWSQIAKIITGRTDLQCRYRYLQLAKATETLEKPADPAPPEAGNLEEIAKKRRNSISIASLTNDVDIEKLSARPPGFVQLPHFFESSLTPRNDPNPHYLHRLPPLLFPGTARKPPI
jgi:hypothetical protein